MNDAKADYSVPAAAFSPAENAAWSDLEARWQVVLENRMREWKLEHIPFGVTDDDIMVFRLEQREQTTESGLVLPDHIMAVDRNDGTREREARAVSRTICVGLLLDAGCAARDWMRGHGVLIGDLIKWGKYAGEEESLHWFSGGQVRSLKDVLLMNVRDIRGSFDLDMRLQERLMRVVYVSDSAGNGMHIVKPIVKE